MSKYKAVHLTPETDITKQKQETYQLSHAAEMCLKAKIVIVIAD